MLLTSASFVNHFIGSAGNLTHSNQFKHNSNPFDESHQESKVTKVDLFDKKNVNRSIFLDDKADKSESGSTGSSISLRNRSMRSQLSGKQSTTITEINPNVLKNLYLVHYVTKQNTIQGISIQYDCLIPVIRKYNRFNNIMNLDDVRIRKLILIPLKDCGTRLQSTEIHQFSENHPLILGGEGMDTEMFLKDAFADMDEDISVINRDEICKLSGHALSRLISEDIKSEFNVKGEDLGIKLEGSCFLNSDAPSVVVDIPESLFFKKKKMRSQSLPLPETCNSLESPIRSSTRDSIDNYRFPFRKLLNFLKLAPDRHEEIELEYLTVKTLE